MIDKTARETQAVKDARRPFAEALTALGLMEHFYNRSAADIDRLIEAAVTGYVESMQRQAGVKERSGLPFDDETLLRPAMLDLNHGSGCQYQPPDRDPGITMAVNAVIDAALVSRNRAQAARQYVSTSGIGRECLRQIQYDYLAVPKDDGRDFEPKTLRIFEAGHRGEDVVAAWLRAAGFDLRTERRDGRQFGFSVLGGRFKGHIDGCLVGGPVAIDYPALWENKALGVSSWKDVVKRGVVLSKPVYAAQLALYQAYMDLPAPALFTALNRDTWEIHCELVPFDAALAQTMSDRAVQVVQASDAQELLPRAVAERTSVVCRGGKTSGGWHGSCSWQDRCWGGCR